jgi:6-phosphogluconolactonase (cycloisomerase 2 family)
MYVEATAREGIMAMSLSQRYPRRLRRRLWHALLLLPVCTPAVRPFNDAHGAALAPTRFTVYTETNSARWNQIVIYGRTASGRLGRVGTVNSGGRGSGILTDTAGALSLSEDGRRLVAVNVGSNSVSAFSVARDGSLRLTGTARSGGKYPNSVTIHDHLVYVLNPPTQRITGLRLAANGRLVSLAGSARPTGGGLGAQIRFNPEGTMLVVTNRSNSTIQTFRINAAGYAQPAVRIAAPVPGPFGFDFAPGGTMLLAITNISVRLPGGDIENRSSVGASYAFLPNGGLHLLSAVENGATLSCWMAVSRDGAYAWTSNFGGAAPDLGSISSFRVGADGRLSLVAAVTARFSQAGAHHGQELAVSSDGRYLYAGRVNALPPASRVAAINSYRILPNGELQYLGTVGGLPGSDTGLVAR